MSAQDELRQRMSESPGRVLPPPNMPMAVARQFVRDRYARKDGELVLRHWRGGWQTWEGPRWAEAGHRDVRAEAYRYTEGAVFERPAKKDGVEAVPWAPNRHKVADLLEALAAIVHLPDQAAQPAWTDGRPGGPIVACANGLLDVERRELLPHSPRFFNAVAVPFDYDPAAPAPGR